jgi:Fe2+ or Zn2+ uptake regulation protein
MAFRIDEVKMFRTIVICDDCKKETTLADRPFPLQFDRRMNRALEMGYTFKDENGVFKNYCNECRKKRNY